jgi:uncharacterized protein
MRFQLQLTALLVFAIAMSGCSATPTLAPTSETSMLGEVDAMVRAEAFLQLLRQGDYVGATATFDERMKGAVSADQLQQIWASLLVQAGEYRSTAGARAARQGQYLAIIQTLQMAKMNLDMRVVFDTQTTLVSGLFFTPAGGSAVSTDTSYTVPPYVEPQSYSEQPVTVGHGDWALPGVLALPNRSVPVPAVVLVHGSGPNDRDETVGGTKPFRDLAGGLASRGIAVLRYDKRTLVYGSRMVGLPITVHDEVIEDVVEAVALLRSRPEVDPQHVFMLGHSLGGMLVPRIATEVPDLAGLIVMAGPSRPLEDLVVEQVNYLANLDGEVTAQEREQIDSLNAEVLKVKALNAGVRGEDTFLSAPASYWLDLQQYDPAMTARELTQPMLFLQGERDYQVTVNDLNGWRTVLGSRSGVQFKVYPSANHLFVNGSGPSTPEEYQLPGHVASEVINDISQWIRSNSGSASGS